MLQNFHHARSQVSHSRELRGHENDTPWRLFYCDTRSVRPPFRLTTCLRFSSSPISRTSTRLDPQDAGDAPEKCNVPAPKRGARGMAKCTGQCRQPQRMWRAVGNRTASRPSNSHRSFAAGFARHRIATNPTALSPLVRRIALWMTACGQIHPCQPPAPPVSEDFRQQISAIIAGILLLSLTIIHRPSQIALLQRVCERPVVPRTGAGVQTAGASAQARGALGSHHGGCYGMARLFSGRAFICIAERVR